ncbi:sensor histidine kinase [Clostridium paridis]|uniref:histidine kinase n=1 Tax=Clostridium paridis TaxID=2803863 RepID=A0A937FI92_9CLOT|nr:HAMP domain-containing sensor histidine kinase [Clostridium paridis]MBL4931926.1 HAMP domain-containing histidine kinase [Clostridium paridis]
MRSILNKYSEIRNIKSNIKKYKYEFENHRIYTNISRCEKVGTILLILNTILLIMDLIVYKPMRAKTSSYIFLFYSHITVIILILLWFILLKMHKKYKKTLSLRVYYILLINISLYWCMFMALNNLSIGGQISAYLICILCISALLYISPLEAFVTYFISMLIFSLGIFHIVHDIRSLFSNMVNVVIVALFAYIASNINFKHFSQDFINNKNNLESKKKLEETNRKLKEYEKLRTDFFANISHELRTPLNVIYCAEQIMEENVEKSNFYDNTLNKYLDMIKQNSYRLIRIIENLIDITKIDALNFDVNFENYDIIRIIEDITMSVADFIKDRGIAIIFDTEIEEKIIACDLNLIERIILNLLSNSVKFTEKGGSIFVKIHLEDNKVCISVKDTGIGIPDCMQELIFDRFIQVDKSISKSCEGSGIGLAIAKSLVEMQGGSISVKSVLGKGSEFTISLLDISINDDTKNKCANQLERNYMKKVRIEFSDIYE